MTKIKWSVTISALDSNAPSETVAAQVDDWSIFAVFPETLLRRLGIRPERQQEFERRDGTREVNWIRHARVTIEGQTGPATVVFGDADETPRGSKVTLSGVLLKVDREKNRLVYKPPRMKPPWWYEHQRKLKEAIERIEAERRTNIADNKREE